MMIRSSAASVSHCDLEPSLVLERAFERLNSLLMKHIHTACRVRLTSYPLSEGGRDDPTLPLFI